MLTTIEGVYRGGRVELAEQPSQAEDGPVLVTFLKARADGTKGQRLQFGKYSSAQLSTEEDFAGAQWHGESVWDDPS
jgi:hypothetical protein